MFQLTVKNHLKFTICSDSAPCNPDGFNLSINVSVHPHQIYSDAANHSIHQSIDPSIWTGQPNTIRELHWCHSSTHQQARLQVRLMCVCVTRVNRFFILQETQEYHHKHHTWSSIRFLCYPSFSSLYDAHHTARNRQCFNRRRYSSCLSFIFSSIHWTTPHKEDDDDDDADEVIKSSHAINLTPKSARIIWRE